MSLTPIDTIVLNQSTQFIDDLKKSTTLIDDRGTALVTTVNDINTAGGSGLLVFQEFPTVGRRSNIRGLIVSSSLPCEILIYCSQTGPVPLRIWTGSGYFNGYIPINNITTGGISIYAKQAIGGSSDAVTVSTYIDKYSTPSDLTTANKSFRFYGDSITNGFGIINTYDLYQRKMVNYIRSIGKSISFAPLGINGTGTTTWLHKLNNGELEQGLKDVSTVFICLGTNDAITINADHISAAQYKINMKEIVTRFLNCGENSKLNVVMIGAVPLGDPTDEANAVAQRAKLTEIITDLGNPTYLFNIDIGSSYAGSNTTYTGDGIHPNAAGSQKIYETFNTWLATTDGLRFISQL